MAPPYNKIVIAKTFGMKQSRLVLLQIWRGTKNPVLTNNKWGKLKCNFLLLFAILQRAR